MSAEMTPDQRADMNVVMMQVIIRMQQEAKTHIQTTNDQVSAHAAGMLAMGLNMLHDHMAGHDLSDAVRFLTVLGTMATALAVQVDARRTEEGLP